MKKIFVTGVGGQVGYEIVKRLAPRFEVTGTDLTQEAPDVGVDYQFQTIDLSKPEELISFLENKKFDLVINPAAYTNTDKAEDEPELAKQINTTIPKIIAEYCSKVECPLIHFSTDYVFNGRGDHFRDENESPEPLSVYGSTKLEGEKEVQSVLKDHLIFRTAWVYSYRGKNFFLTMNKFAKEREELRVIDDQIGSPTSAAFLAEVSSELATRFLESKSNPFEKAGIYHLVNEGITSWHGFTEEIVRQLKESGENPKVVDIKKIKSEDFPSKIERPKNSRLDCSKFDQAFGMERPHWKSAFAKVVDLYRSHVR